MAKQTQRELAVEAVTDIGHACGGLRKLALMVGKIDDRTLRTSILNHAGNLEESAEELTRYLEKRSRLQRQADEAFAEEQAEEETRLRKMDELNPDPGYGDLPEGAERLMANAAFEEEMLSKQEQEEVIARFREDNNR